MSTLISDASKCVARKTNDELNIRKELNFNDGNIKVMFQKQ